MTGPVLETPRLRLRPFAAGDVDALHAQWTDPDVRRYLWDGRVIAREEAQAAVEESIAGFATRRYGFWAVEPIAEPPGAAALLGFTGVRGLADSEDVELYYGLARPYWGHGYATEASRAVLRYAFTTLGRERVYIRTDGPNAASVAVMRRLGARFVREDLIGAFGSTIVYVTTRAEWL
jgi:RimJ/RimL family protein N-acetyltransferase